jgi:hypothetical protein
MSALSYSIIRALLTAFLRREIPYICAAALILWNSFSFQCQSVSEPAFLSSSLRSTLFFTFHHYFHSFYTPHRSASYSRVISTALYKHKILLFNIFLHQLIGTAVRGISSNQPVDSQKTTTAKNKSSECVCESERKRKKSASEQMDGI